MKREVTAVKQRISVDKGPTIGRLTGGELHAFYKCRGVKHTDA